jgi:hypothetical protein
MSLHHLAEQVRAAGRKNDKVLVHMTPNEVNGLQALALAHGGSLTINPDTGLPEADFLDAILPMAAGFLLAPLTAGTSLAFLGATPLASALTVGAVSGLATGSLEKGLMAGLGAYGGAGLGAGLSSSTAAGTGLKTTISGSPAVGSTSGLGLKAPTDMFASGIGNSSAATLGYSPLGTGTNLAATNLTSAGIVPFAPAPSISNIIGNSTAATNAITKPISTNSLYSLSNNAAPQYADVFSKGAGLDLNSQIATSKAAAANLPTAATTPGSTSMFSNYSMPNSFGEFYDKLPTGTLPALAVTGMQAMKSNKSGLGALPVGDSYERPYEYSVEQDPEAYISDGTTRERAYFKEPRFTALPIRKVADGGLMDDSVGNVERMSEGNMVNMERQEDGIPRYGLGGSATAFAKAKEEPSTNVAYTYDPASMQYTQTTTNTPAPTKQVSPVGFGPKGGAFTGFGNARGIQAAAGGPKGGLVSQLARQMPAPQPTVTTETLGGVSTPFVPQGASASTPMFTNTSLAPNINLPEQKTPEEQLGLQGFYQNMEKQLAAKGAQIMSQNMAGGGMADAYYADGGYADGGYTLGGYSDGGRLLKGPGDGVSDSIPAVIGDRQPARLADGEFVVPARIVSELGNGSTEAGAKKLYAMMNRVQNARKKSIGKGKVAVNSKAEKLLPA